MPVKLHQRSSYREEFSGDSGLINVDIDGWEVEIIQNHVRIKIAYADFGRIVSMFKAHLFYCEKDEKKGRKP